MEEKTIKELAVELTVEVTELCDLIKAKSVFTNQLLRSCSSIGANAHEAKYAHSRADFISKLEISLKECYETDYWLELFLKAGFVEEESVKHIITDCGRIRYLLIKSINTLETKIKITSAKPKSE